MEEILLRKVEPPILKVYKIHNLEAIDNEDTQK